MFGKRTEAAIRVGADGAEWLVWQSKTEQLASGRMTASYSVRAALDQWLARAARLRMKPKRIWIIAGAAECAHRRITLPGTDLKVINPAIPLAVEEDLPLPLSQMYWTYRTVADEVAGQTLVDVVASPQNLYTEWEEAIAEKKVELAGIIPEGPHLWLEIAAMRGSEIDLLTVWGERRATLIRGSERAMETVTALVREQGESWEAVLNDLRRPFQGRDETKTILSVFTSDRLRRRILALPELIPVNSENYLNHDVFLGLPDQMVVPVSLLALRRIRIEARDPGMVFGDAEVGRGRVELKSIELAPELQKQVLAVAALVVLAVALWWGTMRLNRNHAERLKSNLDLIQIQQMMLDQRDQALKEVVDVRADWGSVWLQLSATISNKTVFKEFSFAGTGIRIDGSTEDQASLDEMIEKLKATGYLTRIRITSTDQADNKKKSFQVLADFNPTKVEPYLVEASASTPTSSTSTSEAKPRPRRQRRGQVKPDGDADSTSPPAKNSDGPANIAIPGGPS